ncbi:MAG: PulJ/GspJ family protein [Chloroflexota bacterium]
MRNERGFTLLEVVLALIIGSMLLTVLVAAMPAVVRILPQVSNTLDLQNDIQISRQWLARDAHSSQTFELLSAPDYGAFEWSDYTSTPHTHYMVTYSYHTERESLVRRVERNGELQSTTDVASNVPNEQDIEFNYSSTQRTVSVDITVVRAGDEALSRNASFIFHLRPVSEETLE